MDRTIGYFPIFQLFLFIAVKLFVQLMTIKQWETGQEVKASMFQEYHEDRGPEAGKPKVSHSGKDMLLLSYFENKGMNVHF